MNVRGDIKSRPRTKAEVIALESCDNTTFDKPKGYVRLWV